MTLDVAFSNRLEGIWWLPNESTAARLAVTNTTGADVDAQVHFSDGGGGADHTQHLHLGPWQLQVLDFGPSAGRRVGRQGGISITYTGTAGGLKARGMIANYPIGYSAVLEFTDPAIYQTSVYHGTGVRVGSIGATPLEAVIVAHNISDRPAPLTDPTTLMGSAGEYFWHLEGTRTTLVYLKNVTDLPQRYHLYLRYEGGAWSLGLRTLRPHESVALDVGEIKASQRPDVKGRTIPTDVVRGQVHWSIVGGDSKAIDGRAEQADIATGVSSTYACGILEDWFASARIDPSETPLIDPDEEVQFHVYEIDNDFNDHHETDEFEISSTLTWTSYDTSIVASGGSGSYTGVDEGTASEEAYGDAASFDDNRQPVPLDFEFDIEVKPKCWQIQNFHKTTAVKTNELVLHFEYKWESNSGNVHDLQAQGGRVHETVVFNKTYASPPWGAQQEQGTINLTVDSDQNAQQNNTVAGMSDDHTTYTPVAPYTADAVNGAQEYWYSSNCKTKQSLATFTIHREIYSFTQSGATKWGVKTEKDSLNGDYKPLSEPELPLPAFGPSRLWGRPISRTILAR